MRYARIAGLIALCTISACADDPRISQPEPVTRPARLLVETFVPSSGELLRARVDTLATRERLERFIEDEAARPWDTRLDGGIKYADLFQRLYLERDEQGLVFASRDGLTKRGAALLEELVATARDGMNPADYHLARINELNQSLAGEGADSAENFALRGDEAELAVTWLQRGRDEFADDDAARAALVAALIGDTAREPLIPRLGKLAASRRESVRPRVDRVVELELRVADGALRAARDLRHFNYKRLSWPELTERGGGKKVIYERLAETFADLSAADAGAVGAVFGAVRPPHPQYARLVDALVRYRQMQERGGWNEVTPFTVVDGASGASVDALRRRLFAEGYGEVEPVAGAPVDAALWAAIHAYQRTHQFAEGPPSAGFWRSINVSVERRIAQMELNLQRYRESYYGGEEDFIFVNIPDFHAEVYRLGERRMRFKVVVGNNDRTCDPESRTWRYPNATPVQWANLDHLMLNPWWNVPDRIFQEEIAPHLQDPAWLAERGYEIYEQNGVTRARQRPSAANALGLVKFIFPNPHSTFMHDTPLKKYFEYPVRPFSHGCVRVHEPLELAAYLMTEYEHGGRERMERILEAGSTIKVEFEDEIPVYFEYYTVRIDGEGFAHFLADPYHHDAVAFGEPSALSCTPSVPAVPEPLVGEPDQATPAEAASDLGP